MRFVFQSNFVHKTQVPFLSVVLFIVLVIYDVFYLHILNNFMIFFLYNKDYIALDLLSTTLTTKWSLNPTDLLLSTNETNPVFSRVYFHWWFLHVVPFFFWEYVFSLTFVSLSFFCVHQPYSIILTTLTRKVSMRKYTRKHCRCDHHKIVVKR